MSAVIHMVVIEHITSTFEVRRDNIQKYLALVQQILPKFSKIFFKKVPREETAHVDMLSKLSAGEPMKKLD